MSFEKQTRVNSNKPSRSGVISSPDPRHQDSIQIHPKSSGTSINLQNQVPRRNVDDMAGVAQTFESEDSGDIAGSEDFVSLESSRHNRFDDDDNTGGVL